MKPGLLQRMLNHPATAGTVLVASFVITGLAWYLSDSFMRQRAHDRFEYRVADTQENIERRMFEYEAVLRAGLGLFNASADVSRDEWRILAESLQLDRYFPGIQGYGFSELVPAGELARHQARLRAEGFTDYAIRPPGVRDPYTAIIYLEPFNSRNQRAFGYDMFSEEVRRAAMARARDTGQPALSGRVRLVQETETDIQPGVLLYLPVYRKGMPLADTAARQAALQGFVYAPFRMRDLMRGILGADTRDVDFELYDGPNMAPDSLLFTTYGPGERPAELQRSAMFTATRSLTVAGREWTLRVLARAAFLSGAEESLPVIVAIGGLSIDLVLFMVIGGVVRRRREAEALAQAMAENLRKSNADLEQFAYAASHDMRQPLQVLTENLQSLESAGRDSLAASQRQHIDQAVDSARRMDEMLIALLEYTRVGRNSLAMRPVDSRSVLVDALRIMQPAIEAAGAEVQVLGEWPLVTVMQDDLVRVFQNIIDNALKNRAPDRKPQIVIAVKREGDHHRFEVRDNGIGLAEGLAARLFRVFERLGQRDRYRGTGIGLALCRKIVEHHGGRIGVSSEGEGCGCLFFFTLPDRAPGEDS